MFGSASPSLSYGQERSAVICRDLMSKEKYFVSSPAAEIIRRLFYDPSVDLCLLVAPDFPTQDHPYNLIYNLINGNSPFFETILESDEVLGDELWTAVKEHLDKSPQASMNSVMMLCAGEWIKRLLPVEPSMEQLRDDSYRPQHYRIQTPLNLFLQDSPIVNKLSTEISTQLQEFDSTLRPKFISLISRFIMILASSTQFPSVSRLILLRHLCKQFHIFCLTSHSNPEVTTLKLRVHVRPMFSSALYQFLREILDPCPSLIIFKDIVDIWLTWVRPWRYSNQPSMEDVIHGPLSQFVQNNEKFYSVLLGTILRRIQELGAGAESARMLKSVFECCWRPPMVDALRLLNINARSKTIEAMNAVQSIKESRKLQLEEVKEKASKGSWWRKLIGSEEDLELLRLREEIAQLDDVLKDAVDHLHPFSRESNNKTPPMLPMSNELHTTPRSRPSRLPDHERDLHTGIMTLTPEGRRQVISRECSFDFASCRSTLPPVLMSFSGEINWLSNLLGTLSMHLSQSEWVRDLASSYDYPTWKGTFARFLLDPPLPRPNQSAPYFQDTMPECPAILNLRFLANRKLLFFFFLLFLILHVSYWFLLTIPLGVFVALLYTIIQDPSYN